MMESELLQMIEFELLQIMESELLQMIESALLQMIELELLQIMDAELLQMIEVLQIIELLQMIDFELLQMIEVAVGEVVIPLGETRSQDETEGRRAKSFETNCTAASAFRLPVPSVTRPSPGSNELVNWTTALTSAGPSFPFSCSSSATDAAHDPGAMLVPENWM